MITSTTDSTRLDSTGSRVLPSSEHFWTFWVELSRVVEVIIAPDPTQLNWAESPSVVTQFSFSCHVMSISMPLLGVILLPFDRCAVKIITVTTLPNIHNVGLPGGLLWNIAYIINFVIQFETAILMHRNKKFWPKCDKNNNVASGPMMGAATFFTYNFDLRENHSTDLELAGTTTAVNSCSSEACCCWLAAKNWVTTSFCSFWRDHSAPIRLNSTQLNCQLSWVESGRGAMITALFADM